jgi:hypothetical protein
VIKTVRLQRNVYIPGSRTTMAEHLTITDGLSFAIEGQFLVIRRPDTTDETWTPVSNITLMTCEPEPAPVAEPDPKPVIADGPKRARSLPDPAST